jgi:DNA repair protein RadC
MRIKEQPLSFRPRERLEKGGAENLALEELIAIIISTGTKGKNAVETGKEIISKYGDHLLTTSIQELSSIKGLGKVKAIKLKSAFEIGLRYTNNVSGKIVVTTSKDAYFILQEYTHKKQEHLLLITLNARNQLISKKVITIGTLDASLFHPREIFAESISDRAAKIVIAHNHPSGSLEPSLNDILMTQKVKAGGELLGIQLVDSIIISEDGYTSLINQI